ncbi:N-acetylneuraminate synthase family protein [Candidatus Parcubacteria bacterium]|nr:N-acetylneuraminate synthase family protein [Candidatus Parcubacteria bacterium]
MSKDIILNKGYRGEKIIIGHGRIVPVIAEAGVLTFGDKQVGFKFVDEAKKIGIKLLKFQCVTPENIVSPIDKHWLNRMRQRALSKKDFIEVMEYGKKKGVICFASTHNEYDLVELSQAGMPILKIGSGDSNNFRMIDMALATKKPVILSLGLLSKKDIYKIVKKYYKFSNQLIILHCTTMYPTPAHLANLDFIKQLTGKFPKFNFGYSGHVAGYNVALAASSLPEVAILEKHLCLPIHKVKPKYESWDIPVALTPDKFEEMLVGIKEIFQAGRQFKEDKKVLLNRKWAHKAICAHYDISKGKRIEPDDLMSIRPYIKSNGHISIDNFYKIVNKKAKRRIEKGEYITLHNVI